MSYFLHWSSLIHPNEFEKQSRECCVCVFVSFLYSIWLFVFILLFRSHFAIKFNDNKSFTRNQFLALRKYLPWIKLNAFFYSHCFDFFFHFVVCREWVVREDNALAQQLQSQESKFSFVFFFIFFYGNLFYPSHIIPFLFSFYCVCVCV